MGCKTPLGMDAPLNVLTRPPDQSPFFSTPNGGHLGVFDSTDVVIMVLHAASVHAVDRNSFRSALVHEDVFRGHLTRQHAVQPYQVPLLLF
jgi:hypothetical protein